MSKIKVGKLTRRLFTLIALLACLTLVAPPNASMTVAATPAAASVYELSGTVSFWFSDRIENPLIAIYQWNGSSWEYHGTAYGNACGYFTYDARGPGEFMGVVDGYYAVKDGPNCGAWNYQYRIVSGSGTAELSLINTSAYMDIYTTG